MAGEGKQKRPAFTHIPVDSFKERVDFDILDSVGAVTETILRVSLEQHPKERLGLGRKKLRHS